MKTVDLQIGALDRGQILRCLNYGEGIKPSIEVSEILDDICHQAQNIGPIRGVYAIKPIIRAEADGILTDKGVIKSRQLARIAAESSRIAFCLVSAGAILDQKIENALDLVEACIWDALGTVLVENAADGLLPEFCT